MGLPVPPIKKLIIISGVLGALTFVWKASDSFGNYIHTDLNSKSSMSEYPLIKLTVEKKAFTNFSSKERSAFLLINANPTTTPDHPGDPQPLISLAANSSSSKQDSSALSLKDWIALIGRVLGALTFIWKVRDSFGSYIHIDLDIESSGDYLLIKSTVENKAFTKFSEKEIDIAFLLIGSLHSVEEGDLVKKGDPQQGENNVTKGKITTNDIVSGVLVLREELEKCSEGIVKEYYEGKHISLTSLYKFSPLKKANQTETEEHIRQLELQVEEGHVTLILLPFFYNENIRIADEKVSYTKTVKKDLFQEGQPHEVRFFVYTKGRLHRSTQSVFIIEEQT